MTKRFLAGAAASVLLAACSSSSSGSNELVVASRNLYLGGDIFSIVAAPDATAAAVAVHDVFTMAQENDFPARATVIANELATIQPDVIALQEVTTWRTGLPLVCNPDGSGLQYVNAPVAATVAVDYLTVLLAALQAKGMEFVVASSNQSFDAEFCSLDLADPTHPIDVRYTDQDVILVRKGLATSGAYGATYSAYVEFPIPGTPVVVPDRRSWNYVAVEKGTQWYNVFETHLEVQEIPTPPGVPGYIFQLAQAGELAGGYVPVILSTLKLPTVLVGDFNTQAEQPAGSPLRTTYDYLTGAFPFPDLGIPELASLVGTVSPFADSWPIVNTTPGLTWGFSDDLLTGTPTQRIDFAFFWNATPVSMATFGGDDFTATNPPRHSSDHLGIVVKVAP